MIWHFVSPISFFFQLFFFVTNEKRVGSFIRYPLLKRTCLYVRPCVCRVVPVCPFGWFVTSTQTLIQYLFSPLRDGGVYERHRTRINSPIASLVATTHKHTCTRLHVTHAYTHTGKDLSHIIISTHTIWFYVRRYDFFF